MTLSEAGLNLIKESEGFSAKVYNDVAGKPTIGYGHLIRPDERFPNGVTEAEATAILMKDVAQAVAAVNRLAPQANQNQFDALVDFCFNLGSGSLKTMLDHGWNDVTNQIPYWNHAGGKVVAGLSTRRMKEVALFLS